MTTKTATTDRPDFQDIERGSPFPTVAWSVDIAFDYLESTLEGLIGRQLDLEPDFQRAHVWTEAQQAAFIEYVLSGGPSARDLYFACEGWNSAGRDGNPCVIVDGKQRLEAVRRFLRDELRVRGALHSEWTGRMRMTTGARFRVTVADINREQTLRWYLALNRGGTPHTDAEIERVQRLLRAERGAR